jgi:hypothetical protein
MSSGFLLFDLSPGPTFLHSAFRENLENANCQDMHSLRARGLTLLSITRQLFVIGCFLFIYYLRTVALYHSVAPIYRHTRVLLPFNSKLSLAPVANTCIDIRICGSAVCVSTCQQSLVIYEWEPVRILIGKHWACAFPIRDGISDNL